MVDTILRGDPVDVANIIANHMDDFAQAKQSIMPYPFLVTALCRRAGVSTEGLACHGPSSCFDETSLRSIIQGVPQAPRRPAVQPPPRPARQASQEDLLQSIHNNQTLMLEMVAGLQTHMNRVDLRLDSFDTRLGHIESQLEGHTDQLSFLRGGAVDLAERFRMPYDMWGAPTVPPAPFAPQPAYVPPGPYVDVDEDEDENND